MCRKRNSLILGLVDYNLFSDDIRPTLSWKAGCRDLTASDMKHVSVIIPTYNRSVFLRRTLEQALRQTYPSFEVIVIDQATEHPPEVRAYLTSIRERILYERTDTVGLTRARNLGMKKARGEVILYLDDDVDLPGDFIWRHLRNYDAEEVSAVAGGILNAQSLCRPEPTRCGSVTWYGRVISNFHASWRRNVSHGPGGNFSFLREQALRCGGFDEQFVGSALREDTDFCLRYLETGTGRMVFEPGAAVFHHAAPSGGCRVTDQAADPGTYSNELYFWLKHFDKRMLPYFILNLFVRFFILRGHFSTFGFWWTMPPKLRALAQGIRTGMGLYRQTRRNGAGI